MSNPLYVVGFIFASVIYENGVIYVMTNAISDNASKIPVVILAGFFGSGKTTLLQQWLQWSLEAGMKPAVVMNEVGEVNLDGQLLPESVAMIELLNGCICCSMRGDFSLKLYELVQSERPDISPNWSAPSAIYANSHASSWR